jgi:hypothetical protein
MPAGFKSGVIRCTNIEIDHSIDRVQIKLKWIPMMNKPAFKTRMGPRAWTTAITASRFAASERIASAPLLLGQGLRRMDGSGVAERHHRSIARK